MLERVQPRMLLLTSGLGLGHVRAAEAVQAAAIERGATVKVIDLWSLMNSAVAAVVHRTYLRLVQEYPELYERLYRLDQHTWRQILESEDGPPPEVLEVLELISGLALEAEGQGPRERRYASDRMLLPLLCTALRFDGDSLAGNGARARLALMKWAWQRLIRRLEPRIREFAPDVIVSTQMIPAAMVSYLKQQRLLPTPMVGVVTDYGVHDFWVQPGITRYCVPHDEIAAEMADRYSLTAVLATGVPLMPGFSPPPSQVQARRELGLSLDEPTILVLGGGLGLNVDSVAARLLEAQQSLRLVIVSGRNSAAHATLRAMAARHSRLYVSDWTERMHVFIRAADLVVGKPGGVTVAEALACGRPLLATRSLGGQEGFNVDFLERRGLGALVTDGELPGRVAALAADRAHLAQLQRRAWLLGRRDGAQRVADLALELAARYRRDTLVAAFGS